MKVTVARIWELDALRGIAVCLMVLQHIAVVDSLLSETRLGISPLFTVIGRIAAILFLLLVGVSSVVSAQRRADSSPGYRVAHFLQRGAFLLALGGVVTGVSLIFVPTMPIIFGILQFIGTTVLFLPVLLIKAVRRTVAVGLVIASFLLPTTTYSSWWLLPLGLPPAEFVSLDYWPLIPWTLLILIGMELGEVVYRSNKTILPYESISQSEISRVFQFLGRYSLTIYFLHIPLIVLVLWLEGLLR